MNPAIINGHEVYGDPLVFGNSETKAFHAAILGGRVECGAEVDLLSIPLSQARGFEGLRPCADCYPPVA